MTSLKIVFVALICLFSSSCKSLGSKELAPGVPVNSYEVTKLDGTTVELNQMFGKVTVLCLMASWCESCKGEFAELNALHRKLSAQGGLVLAVGLDDTLQALNATKETYGLEFPVVYDSKGNARKVFKLTGFPETLVLDSQGAPRLLQDLGGNLTLKFIGPRPWDQALYQNQIFALLDS